MSELDGRVDEDDEDVDDVDDDKGRELEDDNSSSQCGSLRANSAWPMRVHCWRE